MSEKLTSAGSSTAIRFFSHRLDGTMKAFSVTGQEVTEGEFFLRLGGGGVNEGATLDPPL